MTWVRRAPVAIEHRCAPPTKPVTYALPKSWTGGKEVGHVEMEVDGSFGDLWRCDACRKLWQVDYRWSARGDQPSGVKWASATWWQRLWNQKTPDVPPVRGGDVD